MDATKIAIQATINANSKKTWEYYTSPEHIVNWNFASDDWECPSATNDMQVGGKYSARMQAKDGSFGFDFEATYNAISEGKSFTYTIPDGRVVDVIFEPDGDNTRIDIRFDAEKMNPVEMQQNGWQAILNNFKKYTEGN
ncbi:MAG: SRPBCC family protein [Saprospiraceae bacterium]|nr:SRPBCC family protein [Saprospiraceae bacterium]MCB9344813.1 SRPBCC domain-containing protein [Lewinellaceae bacterium]